MKTKGAKYRHNVLRPGLDCNPVKDEQQGFPSRGPVLPCPALSTIGLSVAAGSWHSVSAVLSFQVHSSSALGVGEP